MSWQQRRSLDRFLLGLISVLVVATSIVAVWGLVSARRDAQTARLEANERQEALLLQLRSILRDVEDLLVDVESLQLAALGDLSALRRQVRAADDDARESRGEPAQETPRQSGPSAPRSPSDDPPRRERPDPPKRDPKPRDPPDEPEPPEPDVCVAGQCVDLPLIDRPKEK